MTKRTPLYPLLFAAYPVVALYAANLQQIPLIALWRPLLAVLLTTVILLMIIGRLLKDWDKTALSVTFVLLLFFSFGHVFRTLRGYTSPWEANTLYLILFAFWASLLIVGSWWIWRMMSQVNENLKRFLNTFSIVVILFPVTQILLHVTQPVTAYVADRTPPASPTETEIALQPPESLPDIYYIILDGYGRADVLAEIYDYDNSPFLDSLRTRGFYVAEKSHSNYMHTALSLSSSLNFAYLDTLLTSEPPSQSTYHMADEIRNSRVFSLLKNIGYKIVTISSGYSPTEIKEADVYLTPFNDSLNDLEVLLIKNSFLGLILEQTLKVFHHSHDAHRTRILHAFESLEDSSIDGPKFVFAHLLTPHPPFIFGPEGKWVEPDREYAIFDGNLFQGQRSEYVTGYRDQLHYINQRLQESVDQILAESTTPPIIIIQGDHGPAAQLHWLSAEETCLKERMAILNAYYLPEATSSGFYDDITPVNSFRVIFNTYFQAKLPLLPDESYFSTILEPYDFTNVTTRIEAQCMLDTEPN